MPDPDPMELEPETGIRPEPDRRPRMDEPLPVRLIAVEDVTLRFSAGLEADLDAFYVGLLQFEKGCDPAQLAYRADNFCLRFLVEEGPIQRLDYRPVQIEVQSLAEAEQKLVDAELEYTRQRGIEIGTETLLLLDPAGNWIELLESRQIM
jgi:hypothetical protein